MLLYKNIKARPELLLATLKPFRGDLVVGVECMHCLLIETGLKFRYALHHRYLCIRVLPHAAPSRNAANQWLRVLQFRCR